MVFNATFNNIVVVVFIGGGNRSTRRKPPICRKSLTNYIQGRIQDFKLGGAHLNKMRRAEGGANILGYFV
jgi:hypothetical protein